ncbi:MAG: peptidase C11 [Lachnospiraceae bacterium]|nr:peptidase C11 [Lachnospiraceae bacterium]
MDEKRPLGREKNVTGKGKGVHRRGEGLGTGPVGSSDGYAGRTEQGSGAGSSGPQRSTRGGGLGLILVLLVALLGGGGGLGSLLLGGGGGGNTGSGTTYTEPQQTYSQQQPTYTQQQTQTPSQTGSYGMSGGMGGLDLSQLSQLFGAGSAQSMTGTLSGWGSNMTGTTGLSDNTATLNTNVASGSRAKYTTLLGGGRDTATIMVYMCGADLESGSGMATSDLSEMSRATIGDNINLIVYTGGARTWKNSAVSNQVNQVYRVVSGGVERLVQSDGDKTMTNPNTLAGFVQWTAQSFPASRYELIFWDHGSGSLQGYGHDEKHPREGSMSLSGINQALNAAGVKFDFIGFDTCLMATAENALMLSKHADYMIASEETEPGTGWYYTNWLTEFSRNPSMSTLEIGKRIIDDFVDVSAQKARGQSTTLSIVDLAELSNTLPASLTAFAESTSTLLENANYKQVSQARNSTREYARSSRIDQVDLAHLAMNMGTSEGTELAGVVKEAVKYNRTSRDMTNSYGLSIYFPYQRMSSVGSMVQINNQIGMDASYSKVIQQFASVGGTGQSYFGQSYGSSGSPFPMLSGSGSYSSSSASGDLLTQLLGSMLTNSLGGRSIPEETVIETLEKDQFDPAQLVWSTQDDGTHTIRLSEDQWDLVNRLDVNVFYDDGEGFVDLGLDNSYQFTEDGELIGETDGTWLAIDDQPVAYYHMYTIDEGDGKYTITGRVPALLNGERVDLILKFTDEDPYGSIVGAMYHYEDEETAPVPKAMTPLESEDGETVSDTFLQKGDTIDFLCDFYDYDGNYQDSYMLGEQLVVDEDPVISNVELDDGGMQVTYLFTDIYGTQFWTPAITQ